jgi:uncharacterized membrane protein YeaQ/YmgE (transglycosylase-associated protein family)
VIAIIRMLVIGLLAGIVARYLYPGAVHMSLVMSAVLGIAGSFLAGFLGQMLHPRSAEELHPAGIVYSILGALLIIFLARSVFHVL